MSILEIIVIFTLIAVVFTTFTICFLKLMRHIECLEDYIMSQKDMISFNNMRSGITRTAERNKKVDDKIEKEQKDFNDYMTIQTRGLCDDEDIERFGVATVNQG